MELGHRAAASAGGTKLSPDQQREYVAQNRVKHERSFFVGVVGCRAMIVGQRRVLTYSSLAVLVCAEIILAVSWLVLATCRRSLHSFTVIRPCSAGGARERRNSRHVWTSRYY